MDANDIGMLQLASTCALAMMVLAVLEFRRAVA